MRRRSIAFSLLTVVACSEPAAPPPAPGAPATGRPGTDGSSVVVPPANVGGDGQPVIDAEEHTLEPPEAADCDNVLEVTYRDFSEDHPDFEREYPGDDVRLQLIRPILDQEGKPQFLSSVGCPISHDDPRVCADWNPPQPVIESAESFAQWYRTVPGVNHEFQKELVLTETPPGSGVYVYESDAFFPLGIDEGFGLTPRQNNHRGVNYFFTTEIHLTFTYQAGQIFTFRGDDDLWIFVNDELALDLGSMHRAWEGSIDFDALASELQISPGGVYRMDVFHAERHTYDSNFRIETNISCFRPAPPRIAR